MAKLVKTYENGTEKFELTLLGETYNFTMIPDSYGMSGDKPGFDTQIPKAHPEYEDFDDYDDLLGSISPLPIVSSSLSLVLSSVDANRKL